MPSRPDVGVVVVAAGRGVRAGGGEPKQFRPVAGIPVLQRALAPFLEHPAVGQVVVVLPESEVASPPAWLGALLGPRLVATAGGAERLDSVRRGLAALDRHLAVAAVHDGARPFVDRAVFDRLVGEARAGRGAIAAIPVADTLKEAAGGSGPVIARTVPRAGLWRAQTPQVFPRRVLTEALEQAAATGLAVTDDAAAVEALGVPVVLVPDRVTNLKITTADDFHLAEAIAAAGAGAGAP